MVTTHIYFNGECRSAIDYYVDAFGADLVSLIENPDPNNDLILHAEIIILGSKIILNDYGDDDGNSKSGGYQLCVDFASKEELIETYSKLKDGSSTIMSPMPTDYSECVVRFIDKFDVHWAFVVY